MGKIFSLVFGLLWFSFFSQETKKGSVINSNWIKEFDSLKKVYPSLENAIEKKFVFDITGDKIPEEVIYSYQFKQDTFFVSRAIFEGKSKKKVLTEQIDFTNDYLFENYFEYDSLYFEYYPYSALSVALIQDTSDYFQEARYHDKEFVEYDVVEHYINKYEKGFKKHLFNYKGLMMNNLSIEPGYMMIWYEPKQEFRVIYAP